MMKQFALGTSLAALLTACGGGTSGNQSESSSNAAPAANTAMSMPSGPFSQVEMQMHDRMAAAAGANASETWTRKMIEHHRGAIEMSQLLIDQGGDPAMVQMARQTVEKQQGEIAELEGTLSAGISGGSGEANPFGPGEQQMHQAMMAATGGNLSETWARKMIVHHQGAVDMSELLIRQGGNPQIVALARRTAADQGREIEHLQAMLRGEPMSSGNASAPGADTAAPPASRPAREPAATPKARPAEPSPARNPATPRPAPKQQPADPHEGHNMMTMNHQ